MLEGLAGFGPVWSWPMIDQRSAPSRSTMMHMILQDSARLNSVHPVRDYLNTFAVGRLKPRLDKWLTTYAGAGTANTRGRWVRLH
jgi:hypothetical protein